jgi:hypothetical protein
MPIVSHTLEQHAQEDGRTYNVLRMIDQDAREYTQTYWAPAGFDHAGKAAATIVDLDEQLRQDEFDALIGADNT